MGGDAKINGERQVNGIREQQGPVPGRKLNAIRKEDPLVARIAAGVLTLTLTATSAAVPPTDAFLNSTNRINNGVIMPAGRLAQAPEERDLSSYLNRVSSNADVAAVVQRGWQDRLLDRMNNLLDALEGIGDSSAGPSSHSFTLLSDENLFRAPGREDWTGRRAQIADARGVYANLTDEQKAAFIESAFMLLAQQFQAAGRTTVSAIGPGVFANISTLLEEAGRAEAPLPTVAAAPVPWYQQIPVVREIASILTGPSVVPTPVEAPETVTLTLEGGGTVTLDESQLTRLLVASGIPADRLNAILSGQLGAKDLVALYYLNEFRSRLADLFARKEEEGGAVPAAVTPAELQDVHGGAVYATMGYAAANLADRLGDEGVNLPEIQQAGFPAICTFLGGAIATGIVGLVIENALGGFTAERIQVLTQVLDIASAEIQRAIVQPAQEARDRVSAQITQVRAELERYENLRSQTDRRATAIADLDANIQRLRGELAGLQTQLTEAEKKLVNAKKRAIVRLTTLARELNNAQGYEEDPRLGRMGTIFTEAGGFGRGGTRTPLELLGGMRTEVLDPAINSGQFSRVAFVVNEDTLRIETPHLGELRPSATIWGRIWADPFRMARLPGTTGVRISRALGALARVPGRALSETFEGQGWKSRAVGAVSLLGLIELGMDLDYAAGFTETRGPIFGLGNWVYGLIAGEEEAKPQEQPAEGAEETPAAIIPTVSPDRTARFMGFTALQTAVQGWAPTHTSLEPALRNYLKALLGIDPGRAYTAESREMERLSSTDLQRAQGLMSSLAEATRGKTGTEAELAFYTTLIRQGVLREGMGETALAITQRFLPGAAQLDVYREIFGGRRAVQIGIAEADLFAQIRGTSAFQNATRSLTPVIDAATSWSGRRGRGAAPGNEEYLENWRVASRLTVAPGTSEEDFAIAVARTYFAAFPGLTALLDTKQGSERFDAYLSMLEQLAENPSMTGDQLERAFLSDQFSRYSNIHDAIENYFTDRDLEKQALTYLLGTISLATSEPGRRPSELAIENRLLESLSESYPAIRTILAEVSEAFPQEGRRPAFSANRLALFADAALFVKANPTATAEQLTEHFVSEFGETYPGSEALLGTVADEYKLRFVLTMVSHRPAGAVLPTTGAGSITEYAAEPRFWYMRTPEWLNETFSGLSPQERASNFTSLPETLQREYWNAHPEEREDIYNQAKKNREWKAAHGEDLESRREGRGRRRRVIWPDWP